MINDPSWTDILQAFAAAIGIPLTLFTVIKLVLRDKERESEINSLSTIASKLVEMQAETEKRYKASKKPYLKIILEANYESKRVKLDFTNSNVQSSITKVSFNNDKYDFLEFTAAQSSIVANNGLQSFWIILTSKTKLFEYAVLRLNYLTEEGYEFIQDIIIWLQDGKYLISPSAIINKENSPLE